jgi:MoaA/NifB/PqqE/SkfB family radical SAM enzyme
MSFDDALAAQDSIRARGIRNLVLGGGEPFAWRHNVVALAARAKDAGFLVQVGTNGVAMPPDFDHTPSIDRYVLPLESIDENVHNAMRLHEDGHHGLVLDRLLRLKRAGKPVTVSTLVTAQNATGLPDIAHFLEEHRDGDGLVHAWHLYKFIPEGRGGAANAERFAISDEEYRRACREVKQLDLEFPIYRRPDMYHSRSVDFFWYRDGALQVGSETWRKQRAPCPSRTIPGDLNP